MTLSIKLGADQAVKGDQIRLLLKRGLWLDGQEHFGHLSANAILSAGEAPAKNDCVVWSQSAWIRRPCKSRLLRSSYCFAEPKAREQPNHWSVSVVGLLNHGEAKGPGFTVAWTTKRWWPFIVLMAEPRSVLPSHTKCSRPCAPPGIWLIIQACST